MSNTTIQITDDQKAELDGLKQHKDESYKSVLQRLIEGYNGGSGELLTDAQEGQVRSIALETVNDRVVREALE